MMPFSVLRMWFGGMLGWLLWGVAAYFLWEWADGIDPLPAPREVRNPQTGNVTFVAPRDENLDRQGGWPYLATAIACFALGTGGFVPLSLILSRPGGAPRKRAQGKQKHIERPDGSRIHVEVLGKDEGPTLLFTHGWSLEGTVWSELVELLGRNHKLVVWDLPGLGRSKGPTSGDYSLEKMADDLLAVAEASGKGPLILVGHSIGGMIAQTFCRLHTSQLGKRVAGIVLLHTTYTNPLNTAFGRTVWKAIERPILVPLNHLTIWLAPLVWISNLQSYLNGSLHVATRIASFSGKQTWNQLNYGAWLAAKAWPGVIARGNLAMLRFDERRTLPAVNVPVLVIAAVHDRMTCRDASDRLAELLPHSLESAVDAGHLGFWERPREICELISEFVERVALKGENTKEPEAESRSGEQPTSRSSTIPTPTPNRPDDER